jgi:hypothetical protein
LRFVKSSNYQPSLLLMSVHFPISYYEAYSTRTHSSGLIITTPPHSTPSSAVGGAARLGVAGSAAAAQLLGLGHASSSANLLSNSSSTNLLPGSSSASSLLNTASLQSMGLSSSGGALTTADFPGKQRRQVQGRCRNYAGAVCSFALIMSVILVPFQFLLLPFLVMVHAQFVTRDWL